MGAVNKADIQKISKRLSRFNIELFSPAIAIKAFSLIEMYALSHRLALADSIIAATAIEMDLSLFTYNIKIINLSPDYHYTSHSACKL